MPGYPEPVRASPAMTNEGTGLAVPSRKLAIEIDGGSPAFLITVTACVARDARGAHDAPRRSIREERAEKRNREYG